MDKQRVISDAGLQNNVSISPGSGAGKGGCGEGRKDDIHGDRAAHCRCAGRPAEEEGPVQVHPVGLHAPCTVYAITGLRVASSIMSVHASSTMSSSQGAPVVIVGQHGCMASFPQPARGARSYVFSPEAHWHPKMYTDSGCHVRYVHCTACTYNLPAPGDDKPSNYFSIQPGNNICGLGHICGS